MDNGSTSFDTQQDSGVLMKEKTLLILSPDFPSEDNRYMGSLFVKQQLDCLKGFFSKVIVIVPVLFSAGLLPNDRYCHDYSYDNVSVYYPRCFFLPRSISLPLINNSRKFSFDTRFHAVQNLIADKDLRFDLIHAHFTWPSAYIATRLKEIYHVPVVATIHEDSGWLEEEILTSHKKVISSWEKSDALIRVNRKEISLLKGYNPSVFFVPNGYSCIFKPLDKSSCRIRLQIPEGKKVLFSVGDLIPRKGFSTLIDAMSIVIQKHPDILCYIGGQGSEMHSLHKQILNNHLEKTVFLLGSISEENLPIWMNCADLFICPSIQESFGIVQIEALACGIPVIASNNVGSKEIVISDTYGYLCNPSDSHSLAEAIFRGMDKEWDRDAILEYSKGYSWERVVKLILQIYSRLLTGEKTNNPK